MRDRSSLRLLFAEIALPLLLLAACEVAFNIYMKRQTDFPLPRLMASSIDTGKYLAFRDVERRREPLDVVFLGISQMMRVSGRHLQEYVAAQWKRPFRSFNFAAPFHTVEFDRRLLEDIVFPIDKPAVVVYGLTPINILPGLEATASGIDAAVRKMPAFALQGNEPATLLRRSLLLNLQLLEYREVLRALFLPDARPAPPDAWIARARQTDSFGDLPLMDRLKRVRGLLRAEEQYTKRFAGFDSLLAETLVFAHLEKMAAFCRQHGVRLVLLLNAVHPLFLEMLPDGRRDYDAFVEHLRATAQRAQVPFFDPAGGGIGRVDFYQDTHHHNGAGAEWLAEAIARFLFDNHLLDRTSAPQRAPAQGTITG